VLDLAWASVDQFIGLNRWLRSLGERILSMASVVRAIVSEEAFYRLSHSLIKMGFVDILQGKDVCRLARERGGVDSEYVRVLLDASEWMASSDEHLGAIQARLRLAACYAEAIWVAFTNAHHSEGIVAESFAEVLLDRVDRIDQATPAATLDLLLFLLAETACKSTRPSYSQAGDGNLILDEGSPAGKLWQCVARWASRHFWRRAALTRAIREMWLLIDEREPEIESAPAVWRPLMLATGIAQNGNELTDLFGAVGTITFDWKTKPLSIVSKRIADGSSAAVTIELESLFSRIVESFAKGPAALNSVYCAVDVPLGSDEDKSRLVAYVDSVVVRADESVGSRLASELADIRGVNDSVSFELFRQIASSTDGHALVRRQFARHTVMAPWSLIREDPSLLLRWVQLPHDRLPTTLGELCHMLSEPGVRPYTGEPWASVLSSRIATPGMWRQRTDAFELLLRVTEVPGSLPGMFAVSQLVENKESAADIVSRFLREVENLDDCPAARLISVVQSIFVYASVHENIVLDSKERNLRLEFADLATSVLEHASRPARNTSLAAVEPSLLRLCSTIVGQLAQGEQVSWLMAPFCGSKLRVVA
jgi:hypothetical protein